MKLVSLKVRNYRIHTEQAVDFDPARTLIGGPNETGKSTLVEAAHRALFLNHRRGGQDLESMRSRSSSEPPEVELVFEQHGTRYTLRKRFNGPKGHAELESEQHERWQSNDAEEKLAALLGYAEPVSPSQADAQWAHLWIRQGKSGEDPSGQATSERDALLARLQAQGGAAVMQSDLDARVAGRFAESYASLFNQNGTPKAGSPLKQAADARDHAQARLDQRRGETSRLIQAANSLEAATRRQAEAETAIPGLSTLVTETEEKLRAANALETELAAASQKLEETLGQHRNLHDKDVQIRSLAAEIEAMAQRITPLRTECEQAAARRANAETSIQRAREETRRSGEALRAARDHVDWLRSLDEFRKARVEFSTLEKRRQQIVSLRESLQEPAAALARLPKVETRDLDSLRKLDSRRSEAAAALDAIATGIEFLVGPSPVRLGGSDFPPGESRVITEAEEFEVAGHRFRIRPGGGNRLDEARKALAELIERLDAELKRLGVTDLKEAIRTHELRAAAESTCQQIRTRIDALEPEATERRLQALEVSCLELEARCQQLRERVGTDTEPDDVSQALRTAQEALESAETTEKSAAVHLRELETRLSGVITAAEESAAKLRDALKEHGDATVRHQTLVETHGDDSSRRERLATLKRAAEELQADTETLRARLADLQPELLKSDLERHQRALAMQKETLQQARVDAAGARAILQRDGSDDPHAAEREAEAALERATETHSAEHRRANAIRRLADLFRDEQQQLSNRFTGPLVDRISAYLQCLFGPQASARISLDGGSFTGLELVRPGGPFDFPSLSGGTKEQLAAAVRLAMAELLAENHSGCLPIVFDDAFTHSDPDRTLSLQRMLDHAASRGLQIVVLTCTPSDYATLGARTCTLEFQPARLYPIAGRPISPARDDESPDSSGSFISSHAEEGFLNALRGQGGQCGNQALRALLQWDERIYDIVKSSLLSDGRILSGKGKGGSVRITTET